MLYIYYKEQNSEMFILDGKAETMDEAQKIANQAVEQEIETKYCTCNIEHELSDFCDYDGDDCEGNCDECECCAVMPEIDCDNCLMQIFKPIPNTLYATQAVNNRDEDEKYFTAIVLPCEMTELMEEFYLENL